MAPSYTSPANDLPSHLASLRNLLQAPAHQGSRFVDFLESAAEVSIADIEHREIGRLRRSDFRHVSVCAVTLDAFTALAARAQHLSPIGIDLGKRPVWPTSIDDLRVYAELFDNPLIFLHFIEQRMLAAQSKHVDVDDEMAHLGLYIAQNNYSQYADELMENQSAKLRFDGFQNSVDEYFSALAHGDHPTLPRQKMPARLSEIIEFLATSTEPHRSELASLLLDSAGDFRDTIAAVIDKALIENKELQRARPASFYGGTPMTLYVWSPSAPRQNLAAEKHVRTVMVAANEASRQLIELEYNGEAALIGAHIKHVSLDGLEAAELQEIRAAATSLQRQRVQRASAKGKIGRNEQCPCGSGKKFKRCHGQK